METTTFIEQLNQLETNSESYKSWGEVTILDASIRLDNKHFLRIRKTPKGEESAVIEINNKKSLHANIYRRKPKINAILITRQTNASQITCKIPPILDDQAQLLGPNLKYVDLKGKVDSFVRQIMWGLNGRYATQLSNGQTVCIGNSLEDAYVAAQLVEKTAKAFLEAKHLGGAKAINIIEAWLMHKFYILKYSRESEKNR